MYETVRLVSDGEEVVLSKGEAFRIVTRAAARHLAIDRRSDSAAPKRFAIQYRGFHDVQDRREYALDARRGEETRSYTVWIELAAFSKRHALLQDGPDICYQKLVHELASSELRGCDGIAVTEADLSVYREAHVRPTRRRGVPSPEPAKAQAGAAPGGYRKA